MQIHMHAIQFEITKNKCGFMGTTPMEYLTGERCTQSIIQQIGAYLPVCHEYCIENSITTHLPCKYCAGPMSFCICQFFAHCVSSFSSVCSSRLNFHLLSRFLSLIYCRVSALASLLFFRICHLVAARSNRTSAGQIIRKSHKKTFSYTPKYTQLISVTP